MLIRELKPTDKGLVEKIINKRWCGSFIVRKGEKVYPAELDGFIVYDNEEIIGLVTYKIEHKKLEITSIDSLIEHRGIGSLMIQSLIEHAHIEGISNLWLVTTNDNLKAISFYRKHGFKIAVIHEGAVSKSRLLKPSIPLRGYNDSPIKDEIEMILELED